MPSFALILTFFPRSSVSGGVVHPHLLRVDGVQVPTSVQQPLPAAAPGRGGRRDGRSVSRSRPLGPEVSGLCGSESSLFLQRDRVRSAGGNFQSEEDVQRARAPERVHLVSRSLRLCWGGLGVLRTSPVQPAGLRLDRGPPPLVPGLLFLLLTWLRWPRPLTGYAKKQKKQTKKSNKQKRTEMKCYRMSVGSPEHPPPPPPLIQELQPHKSEIWKGPLAFI